MITLYCYSAYEGTVNMLDYIIYDHLRKRPKPLDLLPLLIEKNLLHTPVSEEFLRRLSYGSLFLDPDPCYLSHRNGDRRPLICLDQSLQAALVVAAVSPIPSNSELLKHKQTYWPFEPRIPDDIKPLRLQLTPELCDAHIWRTLNSLDQPIELAADCRMLAMLQRSLEQTPPLNGPEAPYCLVRDNFAYAAENPLRQIAPSFPLSVLTFQSSSGRDGDTILTDGDGFDLVAFHWQDPESWDIWDLFHTLQNLPDSWPDPDFPIPQTRYTIQNQLQQDAFAVFLSCTTFYLMILEKDADGHWVAWDSFLENCESYDELFDEALQNASDADRWVLAVELDRPPLCLQELSECDVLLGFHLHSETVTLTDSTNALRPFLHALQYYRNSNPQNRSFISF